VTEDFDLPEATYQTATFTRADGRVTARFGLTLDNHVEEVWAGLIGEDKICDWLAPGVIDARLGGAVKLNFADSGIVIDSTVSAFENGVLLEYSWSRPGEPERPIRFVLEAVGAACGLALSLNVPETEDVGRSAAGWAAHIDMLVATLAGAPITFPFEVFKGAREVFRAKLAAV
jgi:uncharacterized protein YndB with AHSA1/START domain